MDVDTSTARFHVTPQYAVQIVGDCALPVPPQTLAIPLPSLTAATPAGFTLRVLLPDMSPLPYNPPPFRNAFTAPDTIRNTLLWSVSWMGVEG